MDLRRSRPAHPALPAVLAAALLLAAAGARAGVPDPRYCDADTSLAMAPAGVFLYEVVLRDESSAPLTGVTVNLDFLPAAGIALCPSADPENDRRLTAITDGTGRAEFKVRGGGQTAGYLVVAALGQTVRIVYPRTTDLDGSLTITQQDLDLHAALPASSRAGDYDGDGDSDAADRVLLQAQIGQDCSTTAVLSFTWGHLKALYR